MALTYQFGTNGVLDTLAAQRTLIKNYSGPYGTGEKGVYDAVQLALDAYNAVTREMLDVLVDFTSDDLRRYGGNTIIDMEQIDEWGTPHPQKTQQGINVGFPLYLFASALQWDRKWLQNATTYEVAAQTQAQMQTDTRTIQRQIKLALFIPTNNLTYQDMLVDGLTLPLRALLNADSAAIPPDPYGQTFDGSTHTHYLGTASLVVGDVVGAIETVVEHRTDGQVLLYINRAQEAAVRAMTGFQAYQDVRVLPATTITIGRGALDQTTLYNRAIGVLAEAEVWVKPWIPTGYMLPFRYGMMKPLAFRTRTGTEGAMQLVFEDEEHPLRAKVWEREFGVGVWNRSEAAILDTTHSTYAAPSL